MITTPSPKGLAQPVLILVVLAILLAVGAILFVRAGKQTGKTNVGTTTNQLANVANVNVNTVPTVVNKTSEWTQDGIPELKIRLKRPTAWQIKKGRATSGFFATETTNAQYLIQDLEDPFLRESGYDPCIITSFSNPKKFSLDEWVEQGPTYVSTGEGIHILKKEQTEINGISGLFIQEGGPNFTTAESFYFTGDNSVIRYGYFTGIDISDQKLFSEYAQVCKQIKETITRL